MNATAVEQRSLELGLVPSLLDRAIFGFAIYDKDLRYLYVNHTLAEMHGLPVAGHIGKRLQDLFPALARDLGPIYSLALETGRPMRRTGVSNEMRAGSGRSLTWVVDIAPITDSFGITVALGVTVSETTQLTQTQTALHDSEERFRFIAQASNDLLWDWDVQNNRGWWSEGLQRGLCHSSESMTCEQWMQLVHPDDRSDLSATFRSCLEGHSETYKGEFRFQRGNGTYGEFAARAFIVRDLNHLPMRVLGAMTDITEHNRLDRERALLAMEVARQKDQLESIVRHVPGVVWEARGKPDESDQRIEYVSDYVEGLLGYSVEEWLSTPNFWLTIVAPEDKATVAAQAAQAFASGGGHRAEFRWLHKDGRRVWVESQTTVIKDNQGRPIGMRGVNIDITERKLLEEQLRQAQKMEAIGLLAGGIAHDFNNMLTVINGYSDLVLSCLRSDDPLRVKIEAIKHSGSRAAALTRQLLIFSRKQIAQPVVISLNDVIQNIQKMLCQLIGENIELVTALQPDLGNIKVDRGQVEQIVMNLVVNSRDAMPRGGKVTIETANVALPNEQFPRHESSERRSYVMVSVTDDGTGMDAETRSRVFEPFFTTKEPGKGTGLGLSTVYGIVNQADGAISVSSDPGHGTTFKIYFPCLNEDAGRPSPAPQGTMVQGSGTILLAEDEDGVREVTSRMLESQGFRVLPAANAEEALLIAGDATTTIDLLLTDVILPKADGIDLSRRLTRMRPNLKLLYMSGYTENASLQQGLLDGSVSFIPKPFDAASLGTKIRQTLAKV